jgi:hypothetical protein
MGFHWLCRYVFAAWLALAVGAGLGRAADNDADLHSVIETQKKQIEELQKRLEATAVPVVAKNASADKAGPSIVGEDVIKQIAGDYLKEKSTATKSTFGKLVTFSFKGS